MEGCEAVSSPLTASVFQNAVEKGLLVEAGDKLVVLDAMKTQTSIPFHASGVVAEIHCQLGALVNAGQVLIPVRSS